MNTWINLNLNIKNNMKKKETKKVVAEDKVEKALSILQKKYGKDVLMQMDKNIDFKVDWVSTGCFSLDEVMGDGLPRGRMIEIFGDPSSGKSTLALYLMAQIQKKGGKVALLDAENCIDINSEIFNPLTGELKTIGEICSKNKKGYSVISLNDKNEYVNSFIVGKKESSKKVKGLEIITKLGKKIKCTSEHQVYVYKKGWEKVKNLKKNDFIASVKSFNFFGQKKELEKAKLLGYMLGDGCITQKGSLQIAIADISVYNDFKKVVTFFGSSLKKEDTDPKKYSYRISERERGGNRRETKIQQIFSNWELRGTHSNTKFIPSEVFSEWDKKSVSILIRSLWMTDGSVNTSKRRQITYSSTSYLLIKQLQHLLVRFGIHCLLSEYKDKRKKTYFKVFCLSINGLTQLKLFNKEIGLMGTRKEKIEQSICDFKKHARFIGEMLPDYNVNIHFKKRKNEFINNSNIFWNKVTNINETILTPYDITIKKNHNYIANDILVHNCFDGSYASNIGLDIKKLLVSQPATLEESMDIIKELVETNQIDMIVVDSVSALVPKSEVEGEDFMKDTMAVQARLMSRALRILSGPISKSKTIVLFINQIRDKVGVFYGAKTTTSGGRALKFFSSIRLEVSKGKKFEGKKEEQVGNQIIITAVKNKVGFPWKKTTLDLYYAKGIDLCADVLDFGEKNGILKKTGITYFFGDISLGVGRDKAKTFLAENEKIFTDIKNEINKLIKKNDN